jgi:RNA polymerase sigma-70 factor (ECF subfamily)
MTAAQRPRRSQTRDATPAGEPELDAQTLERARNHDLAAFEQVYRVSAGRVYALCLRLCGDAGRAEDLVQEVFLRVWQRIDRFEGRSRFSTWLYRLTVNRVMDVMRHELRRSLRDAPAELAESVAAPHAGAGELGFDLEAAIAELPPGARWVFVLHDVEGYAHEEIAEMTGIAVGTSKSQLYRARRLLRERLSR